MYRHLAVAIFSFFPQLCFGQWLDLKTVLRWEDVPENQFVDSRFRLSDNGQVFYRIQEYTGPRISIDPEINRFYIDDTLVHEVSSVGGNSFTAVGDINRTGHFTLTSEGSIFLGTPSGDVKRVLECGRPDSCELQPYYVGHQSYTSSPRLDDAGNVFFIASRPEEVTLRETGYYGLAAIYRIDPVTLERQIVFDDLFVDELTSALELADLGWDVNSNGTVTINRWIVPVGSQVLGEGHSFDEFTQTSLNNSDVITAFGFFGNPGEPAEHLLMILDDGPGKSVKIEAGKLVDSAFINDQEDVLFSVRDPTFLQQKDLHFFDGESGEVIHLLTEEDGFFSASEFNNRGEFILTRPAGAFIASLTETPVSDIDYDGATTGADFDRVAGAIRGQDAQDRFDLNRDRHLTSADLDLWITDLVGTRPGDADLNGKVDFRDFLILSENYESNAGWSTGDFDGSSRSDFGDFLLLSNNFGFVSGNEANVVPEPQLEFCWVLALLLTCLLGRNRCLEIH